MNRAVILTTAAVFDRRAEHRLPSPLTIVGGLSLFQRTILTLQRGGITRFMILGGDQTEMLRDQLQGDRRVTAEVRWLPVREFPPSDYRTWEIVSGMIGGGYLVAGTGAIFSAALIAQLRETVQATRAVLIMPNQAMLEKEVSGIGVGPSSQGSEDGVVMVETPATAVREASSLALDLVAIPEGFTAPGWANIDDCPHPLRAALERGLRLGQVKVLPLGEQWYEEVRATGKESLADAQSVIHAEWTLARSLKGGHEGFIDRYFNRKCSRWLTHWFLQTPLTPNAITLLATAVGLVGAGAFAVGGYLAGIIGALLFQLSAILDCCDGEVARIKFLESRVGEKLDIILDNVVHIALFAGMAWGVSVGKGGCPGVGGCDHTWDFWALLFGGLAIFGNVAAFAVVQSAMRVRRDMDQFRRARIDFILNRLTSRDFSVIVFAFALIGHIEWFLLLAAIGSNIFWPFLAWQLRSSSPVRQR
jgi:1L-myo-inositol 1-phosphate cytidylyltransferase / CDP-L-myo-inositol myo-inositolphosphotransferase